MGGFDESDQKAQSWVGAFREEQQNAPVLGDPRTNQRRGKRVLDLAVACPLLLLCAPLMIGLTIVIRLSSRGPAIFRQIRIGQNERPFTMFKFRTMYLDTDDTPLRQMNIRELSGGRPGTSRPADYERGSPSSAVQLGRAPTIVQCASRRHVSGRASAIIAVGSRAVHSRATQEARLSPRHYRIVASQRPQPAIDAGNAGTGPGLCSITIAMARSLDPLPHSWSGSIR